MSEKDNGKDAQEYPQLIFKAEVILLPDGKKDIGFTFETNHIRTLDTVSKELDYHIIELRAQEKTKQEMNKLKIITKGPMMSLQQFLNRKRR